MEQTLAVETTAKVKKLCRNIGQVILGKSKTVRMTAVGLLSGGHILIEDVPGVGKSTLARAIAKSLACTFNRIQFTPDLLPSDIIGVSVFNSRKNEFEFKHGPIFANIILADEINRTTPRTQSALLEAMNLGQVTADGHTYLLPKPFMVVATQNPLEYTGTYPLPESQLDRFALRISMHYPDRDHEKEMLQSRKLEDPIDRLSAVISSEEIIELYEEVKRIRVEENVIDYLQDIVQKTREHKHLLAGVSPRGTLSLYRSAQAHALIKDRTYVMPDDIKILSVPALAHRIVTREQASGMGRANNAADIIRDIVSGVRVPA